MSTPLLEIDGLTVRFGGPGPLARAVRRGVKGAPGGGVRAVDGVSLTVPRGGAVGVVGESGSGKSTLMRAVLGLVPPTAGTIRLDGRPLGPRRDTATRRAVQMVFQDPGTTLNPARTCGSILAELLRVHRIVPADRVAARVTDLLDLVRLPHGVAGTRPHRLSGGQKQRVAIARALALEPRLLIADEATSALDVVVQASVLDLLAELRATTGVTLVAVSHDLDLVRYLCDTAVVMRAGKIVESGPVAEILSDPAEPYTRELIAAAPTLSAAPSGKDRQ
ncbi:ATP-binding cassette domain-containing protein [Actinocorallia sp. API 0066]|uniref:ABC transporter ATP-binding protein n=1 Tax=Actinocorallia sp. API 0066 TaxID=2896846 RepID=UPI001E2C880D|nr:ATP-binding cassette domain-containing protein [Actinocorallia sp. API 0066]MCD0449712.1 ATP-binding cassette domain-containing protein [Actinocorallia sp. API 0066]